MSKKEIEMSFLSEPTDANFHGNVHGGKVMKWIDEVGYALAVKYSEKYCVTKFVDGIEFLEPCYIGDLVTLKAKIIKIGRTSLRIHVEVYSEHLIKKNKKKNCSCDIIFVALDINGKKTTVN